jgi:cardiolipin synthase (CMP-forming)
VNLPNLISLARLLAVPFAVYLILEGAFVAAFWLFMAAGITDAIDGFLAKRFDMTSTLGGFLDPLADKALLVSVYVALGHGGHIATWLVILVVFRDVLIIGGVILMFLVNGGVVAHPLIISKVNTAAQIALVAVVLAGLGVAPGVMTAAEPFVWLVAATTLASGGAYLVEWVRQTRGTAPAE